MHRGGFPDLRAFIDRLRRDADLAVVEAPVDPILEAAEIHRRVIAAGGPALLFTNVTGASFPLVTNLFGTARRAELAFGDAPAAAHSAPGRAGRDAASADAGKALGRARRRRRAGRDRHAIQDPGAGDRGDYRRRPPRPAAGPDLLAGGRRTVHHAAAGLHRAPGAAGPQPRHVPAPRARRPVDGHALADRQGGRLPLRGGRGARRGASRHCLPGRPAGADARGHRAAAGERARADAGLAHRRRAAAGGRRDRAASPDRQRGVRAAGIGGPAGAAAGGPLRRPLRVLLAGPRLPGVHRRPDGAPEGRHLPGNGRRQAAAGGLLHRRSAAGAALAPVSAGDARCRGPLVLR